MINPNRDTDRAKEKEKYAAWMLAYITGRQWILMPEFSPFDFVVASDGVDATVTAIAEFRSRDRFYDTVVLRKKKVDDLRNLAESMTLDCALYVIEVDGEYHWVNLLPRNRNWRQEMFSRNVQERHNDRPEMVYHIPRSEFRKVQPRLASPGYPAQPAHNTI